MSDKLVRTPLDDLTYRINGAAMAVHRRLGALHKEEIYQRALEAELERCGLSFESQKNIEIYDQGRLVGYYIPDLIVEGKVVVELKALGWLDSSHLAQVIVYLGATQCPIGLLIDFGGRSLRIRRVFPSSECRPKAVADRWLYVPGWLRQELRSADER